MLVDLENKVQRLLVQNYVNGILNYRSEDELYYDLHKLIHTFDVVQMASRLINLTQPALNNNIAQRILDAAVLHDIGRLQQFKDGVYDHSINHGQSGAIFLENVMPNEHDIIETVRWHSSTPSDRDPKEATFLLAYVRDADMLANMLYCAEKPELLIKNLMGTFKKNQHIVLDVEVEQAFNEHRATVNKRFKDKSFITMLMAQLSWFYILRTDAAFEIVKQENLLIRIRDAVINKIIPLMTGTSEEKEQMQERIRQSFKTEQLKQMTELGKGANS